MVKNLLQVPLPNLNELQRKSYFWFIKTGLKEEIKSFGVFDFPYVRIKFEIEKYKFSILKLTSLINSQNTSGTYSTTISIPTRITDKKNNYYYTHTFCIDNFPLMTSEGHFYINGVSRVIVNQIIRSPGIYFESQIDFQGKRTFTANFIANRGSWFKFETDRQGFIWARVDKVKKLPAIIFLKALGFSSKEIFSKLDFPTYLIRSIDLSTQNEDFCSDFELDQIYSISQKLALYLSQKYFRPEKPANINQSKTFIYHRFLNFQNYDLGLVGRYKINKKFKLSIDENLRNLTPEDIFVGFNYLINLSLDSGELDDIDHLKNRRIRSVGELLQNQLRVGLVRFEKYLKEKYSKRNTEELNIQNFLYSSIFQSSFKEFFGSNPLSQFMHQTNSLSEITHKRRLSCLGPGGLSRERASFLVRDIHLSHYGRICPIETPEGPNAGLISSLATFARINKNGFIESPFKNPKHVFSNKVFYLSADDDNQFKIAPGDSSLNLEKNRMLAVRAEENFTTTFPKNVDYQAISTIQTVSIATALIPFLEHDDANRALMGSNMQRQAIPLVQPKRSRIGTGLEAQVAMDSETQLISKTSGIVSYVDTKQIKVLTPPNKKNLKPYLVTYFLSNYNRTNQNTTFHQRPQVFINDWVNKGDFLANGGAVDSGELALGKDLLIAYMPWHGYNFEDALLISENLLFTDSFTSIHVEKIELEIRQTKFGDEWLTPDIPTLSKYALRHLNSDGLVKIGSWVIQNDILVGKLTPNPYKDKDQSPERHLLRDIFGENFPKGVPSCLKVPPNIKGRVIDIRWIKKNQLSSGVLDKLQIFIAQKKKLQVGDKMAGRHGNKGIISNILARSDMPYLPNGQCIDIVLNPLGIPSRMNVGQVYEALLGFAADLLNQNYKLLGFDEKYGKQTSRGLVFKKLYEASLKTKQEWVFNPKYPGKMILFDGRTGRPFDQLILVGKANILKLDHLVDHKIHARSTGPYSLITQQPLGGRSKHGGQRLGEMEVWALEGYGAAYTLQELLTLKSDDIKGRNETFNAIVKGNKIPEPSTPESFKVLIRELHSLCLDINIFKNQNSISNFDF